MAGTAEMKIVVESKLSKDNFLNECTIDTRKKIQMIE